MGKYDTCMQEYLQNKQYFADLFNGCFFHGKPVICASELTEASEGYVVDQDNTITSEKTLAAKMILADQVEEGDTIVITVEDDKLSAKCEKGSKNK